MKNIKILLFSAFLFVIGFNVVLAAPAVFDDSLKKTAVKTGHTTYGEHQSISQTISQIIAVILSLVGVIFLILIIYAGFLWMTARGNEQQIEKAKTIIINSIIGIFVVLSAYAISYLVVSSIGN